MNTFILRWNPAISSYKMEEHLGLVSYVKEMKIPNQFDWSICEWESLKVGDIFILLQVGTDNDGIAMLGRFCSAPYEDDSWRKDGSTIHYADMEIFDAYDLAIETCMRASNFEKEFPEIKWHGGHSGEMLEPHVAERLLKTLIYSVKDAYHMQCDLFNAFMMYGWDIQFEDENGNKI